MKYKAGDKVTVREWNDMVEEFGCTNECINTRCLFMPEMREFCGKEVTISCINDGTYYKIKEDGRYWCWTDEVFEGIEQPENHWAEIAGWYGLELDEEFNLPRNTYNPYKFTKKGLVNRDGNIVTGWLDGIINGELQIEKLLWKPKDGDI